ncbi:PLD nuclease N-terminal domain-containing protein [Streptomyces fulvoviolaceus]|uniref:PLD nuclease N-terminal domain-containing protein n=1 Tax=Streptomyces fulvoviolaceus TaxID=285535 RepID=UPI0004C4E97E|nr:PLD nuclease N-terminal domain-containing protein [Streptomyces fulvoviolaceus]MCT9082584.1 PLD nuclease N-terminal domain-containing protein [Streptomyces fulvoviolaceus]
MLRYLPFLLVLALWIYAFVDCLNTPEKEVRGLPKVVWIIIILLFGEVLIGPVAWLVAGKVRQAPANGPAAQGRWVAPDDNPEFLKSLNEDDRTRDDEKRDDRTTDDETPPKTD